ncbi:hypothetical protein OHAE_5137 [Ochrobactrum soli]|uniref:Uncharacterized protein n=1 Tax=Ochrobactrum soli TaxID=2448455 RepID=A0A2P9HFF8_9HYPH|nr:hypothetical protein OHAE_5137 [[Ochrobactrum] soli]
MIKARHVPLGVNAVQIMEKVRMFGTVLCHANSMKGEAFAVQ